MKKVCVAALVAALVGLGGPAFAQGKVWDDLSWWGQSGATPGPVHDEGSPCGDLPRSRCWWWPTEAQSNVDDSELWGNRGVVYAECPPTTPEPPPPPPPPDPPKVERKKPAFNNVLFDLDKAVLKPEGKAVCDEVAKSLKDHGRDTVVVTGHTCDLGSDEYNMGLGQRRADSVTKYLLDNGIAASRVAAKSCGEAKPAVPNTSPPNRKLNRRVMFDVTVVD